MPAPRPMPTQRQLGPAICEPRRQSSLRVIPVVTIAVVVAIAAVSLARGVGMSPDAIPYTSRRQTTSPAGGATSTTRVALSQYSRQLSPPHSLS